MQRFTSRNSFRLMLSLVLFGTYSAGQTGLLQTEISQPETLQLDSDARPERGVGRISLIERDVSVRRGDSGEYVTAVINAPLVVDDHVFTASGSRAELQFDSANMIRIDEDTEVRIAELSFQRYIVQLARGTATWRVLRDQEAYAEFSTPSLSVRPIRPGIYRVTVADDGSTRITVRSGEAEIFTPRGTERLLEGKALVARGLASDPDFRTVAAAYEDEWDLWNRRRDEQLLHSQSYNYISRDIYGAEDLDSNGSWVTIPTYGSVWSPRVASDWAPYRNGRWAWVDWYGWSWVSYDSWGWAPHHYGRWFHQAPYGWVWYPGRIRVRHNWAPGYVAFFGVGSGLGWLPLGPHEPFYPWWGSRWYNGYRNRTFIDNSVTVVRNVNITNVYRNARVRDSVTVLDRDGFRRGRPGSPGRLADSEFRQASLARGPLPIAPANDSMRFDGGNGVPLPPRGGGSRNNRFFSNRQPSPIDRVPLEEQRRGVEQFARGWQTAPQPAPIAAPPAPTDDGWVRFGNRNSRENSNEWERFGGGRMQQPSSGVRPAGPPSSSSDRWNNRPGRVDSPQAPSPSRGGRNWGGNDNRSVPQAVAPQAPAQAAPRGAESSGSRDSAVRGRGR